MRPRLTIVSAVAVALLASSPSWAADGAALYKSRCANCHGANGEGRSAMKAPAFKGATMSEDQIAQLLTAGASGKRAPHAKAISRLNADDAKAIAAFVKTLQ
jgi:cytochrome c553